MSLLLECRGITKNFGGLTALTNINLQAEQMEIVGIIGPNGAGKTTLFNIISGAIPPTRGRILFKGQEISSLPSNQVCRLGIARTYQLVRPFNSLTTLENVLVGETFGRSHPKPLTREERITEGRSILRFMGLETKANQSAENLTLVEKKHLEIARALATRPEIILLDEVVSGLTPTETLQTIRTIRQIQDLGITVIMIEHVLKVVLELCKRIIVLNYGIQIAEGSPQEIIHTPQVIEAYLGKFKDGEESL